MRAIWKGAVSFGLVNVPVRVYAATDRDCVNVVFRSSVVGGPAFAPRMSGPLKLPTTQDYALWFEDDRLDEFGNASFHSDLPASPYFNTPLLYQAPRSIQFGVKFTY